jgi:hypothetical protein
MDSLFPNPQPTVIGPNFGDQSVKEVNVYQHAPQLTYEFGGSAHRDNAEILKNSPSAPTPSPVTWAVSLIGIKPIIKCVSHQSCEHMETSV